MVAFTTLVSAISMALLASTAKAVPTPPPTSSALDFTIYSGQQSGLQNQCYDGGKSLHVAPADLGKCNQADVFYTARIDAQAYGYSCNLEVYTDDNCTAAIGGYSYPPDWSKPCQYAGGLQIKYNLNSWKVTCTYTI
ncbi:hypothetical protein N431DRAFT_436497 [Stipitochalara longipes BDJ]|nr:hypothetical protein N431DRAFT_436497 [Stipitochalara longipes BDJ]